MIILGLLILVFVIYSIGIYNSLVRHKNNVNRSYSTIDVMLKKRYDLIPNLVQSVKQYMTHEKELLSKITELRTHTAQQEGAERMKTESQLSSMLGKLNVSIENYPDLKADRNVQQLQAALNEVEEQVAAARSSYNGSVLRLNNKVESFPSSIIARLFGFQKRDSFEINITERENIDVGQLFNN